MQTSGAHLQTWPLGHDTRVCKTRKAREKVPAIRLPARAALSLYFSVLRYLLYRLPMTSWLWLVGSELTRPGRLGRHKYLWEELAQLN